MEKELGSLAKHRAWLGLPPKKGSVAPFPCSPAKVFAAQVAGLVRRLRAIRCRDVVVGVSGGLDSALALLVCREAFTRLRLDPKRIHAITMPGFGTTRRTRGNALALAEGLGVATETIPIGGIVRRHLKEIGHDGTTPDAAYENAQARMRTMVLMDRANMVGGIVVGTGDLSEIAIGWCTYNGDHMSMFGVNSGVPKTVVRKVCSWWASRHPGKAAAAIEDIVATPVSPELVKGQVTERTIGPYDLHDCGIVASGPARRRGEEVLSGPLRRRGDRRDPRNLPAPLLHPGLQAQLRAGRDQGVLLRSLAARLVDSIRPRHRQTPWVRCW